MEPTHFELTPEQKGMLASLLSETGQPASTLAAAVVAALEELRREKFPGDTNGHEQPPVTVAPSATTSTPIWEVAEELFSTLSDEELALFPPDGATQHDHYIYGTPKRPA